MYISVHLRKSLQIGIKLGNDSDGNEVTADTKNGLKNGKFLLIGSDERKNEFFKFCFPGILVFIMSFITLSLPAYSDVI